MRKMFCIVVVLTALVSCSKQREIRQSANRQPEPLAKPGGGSSSGAPTIYTTGDAADVSTTTQFGIALMGGADANTVAETAAFQFLVSKSGGGDFVVLRASGADGYNSFVFNTIGGVNSVQTLIVDSRTKADHATTESIVRNAEAIFIAGGNQADYINFWKGTKLQAAIQHAVTTRNVPIGGSSAGLAVLGQYYYGATAGSATSSEALSNPYHKNMAGIGGNNFLQIPFLQQLITDSHYGERTRQGRHFTFMARLVQDFGVAFNAVKGIGVDEATSVLVESNGSARVYGRGKAYFLRGHGGSPEQCVSRKALTWHRSGQAVASYEIQGSHQGTNGFNLASWSGSGGTARWWHAQNGSFTMQ